MKLYEENIAFIEKVNPELHKLLLAIKERDYSTVPSKKGGLTLTYRHEGEDFFIHSRFNPEAEAEKMVGKSNPDADHIVVLGLGAGYHLEKLMALKAPNARVLLVEPEPEILKHSLKTINWKNILGRKDFFYSFGRDLNLLAGAIQAFIDVTTFTDLAFLELASEVRFHSAFFNAARETIDSEVKTLFYDFRTRLAEDSMVPRNIIKNIPFLIRTRPVKELKNKYPGRPGFIVSAGPSLDKNILLLKKVRDRAVIICVDTAFKPLLKKGIHPHFIMSADPSYKNYLHLQGTEEDIRYFLVADSGIAARAYEDFQSHIFTTSLGKPLLKMIEQNIGEIGEIEAWGSVISLALNFALYIGLDPIVFLGQDFAFTDMRNHCRGTSWEDSWMEYSRDLDGMQRREKKSIGGIAKVVETPDIFGKKTITSDKLQLYKNYLTKVLTSVPGRRFINASEGGILSEIETRRLRDVLKEFVYHREPDDFGSLFEIPTMYSGKNEKQLLAFFKGKLSFFRKYGNKLEDILSRLKSVEGMSIMPVASLLQEAEKLKDNLYINMQNGEILEMWSQGPIYNFLRKSAKLKDQPLSDANRGEFTALFREYFEKLIPLVSGIIDTFEMGIRALQKKRIS